jgi:hypothetical protein
MRAVLLAPALVLALAGITGCDANPRQVGDIYVQGSPSSYNYYGEFREKREGGKDRIFLFFDPATVQAFADGSRELPLSKTMIGKGPNKETIHIEQVKDPEQSKIIATRLIKTFNAKNNASVALP